VIEVFERVLEKKDTTRGLKIIEEPKFLRHFTAKFDTVES